MAAVGNIKAELLLKFEGMEDPVSLGHIEVPVKVTADEEQPGQLNVSASTKWMIEYLCMSDILRNHSTRNTKEN